MAPWLLTMGAGLLAATGSTGFAAGLGFTGSGLGAGVAMGSVDLATVSAVGFDGVGLTRFGVTLGVALGIALGTAVCFTTFAGGAGAGSGAV